MNTILKKIAILGKRKKRIAYNLNCKTILYYYTNHLI